MIDLEFVQNLSNARYLQFLAQQKYFEQDEFMAYLDHLRYWKRPEYCRLLLFPQCLTFLDLLIDNEKFRNELSFPEFVEHIHQQQGYHWMSGDKQ